MIACWTSPASDSDGGVALHPAGRVEHGPGRHAGDPLGAADQADVVLLARSAHHQRGGDGDAELVLLIGAIGIRRGVEDDGRVVASGVVVLPDQQLARAGRGAPVHVAQVVAGDVLAQRVEGQVAHRDAVARHALEVAHLPGPERGQQRHPRPDVELDRVAPAHAPAQQPQRIGAGGDGRADVEHPALEVVDLRLVAVAHARGQRRHPQPHVGLADGEMDERLPQREPAVVDRGQADLDPLTGHRARRSQRERGPHAHRDQQPGHGEQHRERRTSARRGAARRCAV